MILYYKVGETTKIHINRFDNTGTALDMSSGPTTVTSFLYDTDSDSIVDAIPAVYVDSAVGQYYYSPTVTALSGSKTYHLEFQEIDTNGIITWFPKGETIYLKVEG